MSSDAASVPPVRKGQNLASRLAKACAAVPALQKLGRNTSGNYDFVYASQVLSAFRQELWKRGILLLPDEKELTEKDIQSMGGPVLRQVTIRTEYEFRDCRGNEPSILKSAFGVGMDHGDKAVYKAKTGSIKYLFKILGMIPWIETDDPEADASLDDKTDPRVFDTGAGAKTGKQKRISDRQVRAFDSACHQSGKTADQVAQYLRAKFSTATVADLPKAEFNDAIKWACQSSDIKQQIEESIAAAKGKKSGKAEPPPAVAVAGD